MKLQLSLPTPAKSRPGESFKNGKLYHFDSKRILVAQPWPEMRAWYKTATKPWQPTRKVDFIMDEMFPKGTPMPSTLNRPFPFSRKAICERCESNEGREWLKSGEGQEWLASNKGQEWLANRDDLEWREQLDWFDIVSDRRHLVLAQFFDEIPDPVRGLVLRFNERRWHLLALFARCPGAFDLAQSNPALAYALASNWAFRQPAVAQPMRAARSLVKKKQRDIMVWLGFPGTEQARKVMAKLPPEEIHLETLFNLRRVLMQSELMKLLSHAPVITHSMVQFLNHPRSHPFLTPQFINDMAICRLTRTNEWRPNKNTWSENYGSFIDMINMQDHGAQVRVQPWRSVRELQQRHDELVDVFNAMGSTDALLPFLPPPYPGKSGEIEPITSFHELQEEGREMRHCVGSYCHYVRQGKCYIYRVISPIRATLSLWRNNHGWELQQLRGMSNQVFSEDIKRRLYAELTGKEGHAHECH